MYRAYWIIGLATMGMAGGCGMHHASKADLLRQANVSIIDAVRTAEATVTNGRTIEAELERKDGRAVYEVKMIDSAQNKHKVYIDAVSGKLLKMD